MRSNYIIYFSLFLLLLLSSADCYVMAQNIREGSPSVKTLAEIKQLPLSTEKVAQLIRYSRNPRMLYTDELKVLLDEALQYAKELKKEDLISNVLSTYAIVELGLGKKELSINLIKQAEGYLSKLNELQAMSLLFDLSRIYGRFNDVEKTFFYYDKIEAFTKDKSQFLIQRVLNLRNRTNLEIRLGNYEKVKPNYELALKLSTESGNASLLKDTRFSYANSLMNMRRDDEAFTILKTLLSDLETIITDRTAQFFDILSRNYEMAGDYKNAFLYAEKEFNLPTATTQQKSNTVNRMILLSVLLKNHADLDRHFAAHQKYGMDENSLMSKKKYYFAESKYYEAKQRNVLAKKAYFKALGLKSETEKSPYIDIEITIGLAEMYVREGKLDSAEFYFKKAEILIKKFPLLSPSVKLLYTKAIKNFQLGKTANHDALVKNLEQEISLKDTLYKMNLTKITRELETKYRVNEKEKELELAKKQQQLQSLELTQQQQRGWLILISSAIVILFILTVTYMVWQRKKQASLLHKNTLAELQQQHRLAILNTLTETQEQEKKRVAERLHDEVGAMLSIAKLNINTLHNDVYVSGSEFADKLSVTQNLMDSISDTVRNLSHTLMPIALEKYGFKAAILDLITAIKTSNSMHVEYLIEGFEETQHWPTNFTLSTYRIIQEIINNSIKHARASHLFVQLIELEKAITIYVEDNGKGLNHDDISKNGIGMTLLQTNIDYLSGKLEIHGRPNEGTFILIELPVPNILAT